jgi:endoglucanase
MSINVALLKKICETPGAPGHEQLVRELITKELKGVVDGITVDNMGNLIAFKKGKSSDKKVMAAAHMDEIGFIVSHNRTKGKGAWQKRCDRRNGHQTYSLNDS